MSALPEHPVLLPWKRLRQEGRGAGLHSTLLRIGELIKLLIAGLALEGICLLYEPLLSLWVLAEQVDAVGQSHCCGFVACQHEEVGLSCNLPAEAKQPDQTQACV